MVVAARGTTEFTTPSDREVVARRTFDAPRHVVWTANVDPQQIPHWLTGPDGWTMPVCEVDLRPEGAWHFVWRKEDGGGEFGMHGVYKEIVPNERLVNTEAWGGDWPEAISTLELSEQDGRTQLTCSVLYASKEARDRALATGMTEGWGRSYERLEEYLQRGRSL